MWYEVLSMPPSSTSDSGSSNPAEEIRDKFLNHERQAISRATLGIAGRDPEPRLPRSLTLTVYLLGIFRVFVNDYPVDHWPGRRARSVMKYLLAHHERPIPREVLMDIFWRRVQPEAARNSLNVALYSLRRAFRSVTEFPIILFEEEAYHLNPGVRIWLDVDEFERHTNAGQQLLNAGQLAMAISEWEVAANLYQGKFLEDDPYLEWAHATREQLHLAYLELLNHLSHIYFDQSRIAACVRTCQLILVQDSTWEETHCLLMRCYTRLGQPHLALRQYQACVESLHRELDMEPARSTVQLLEKIRRHEQV